jgi:hypothetical protein
LTLLLAEVGLVLERRERLGLSEACLYISSAAIVPFKNGSKNFRRPQLPGIYKFHGLLEIPGRYPETIIPRVDFGYNCCGNWLQQSGEEIDLLRTIESARLFLRCRSEGSMVALRGLHTAERKPTLHSHGVRVCMEARIGEDAFYSGWADDLAGFAISALTGMKRQSCRLNELSNTTQTARNLNGKLKFMAPEDFEYAISIGKTHKSLHQGNRGTIHDGWRQFCHGSGSSTRLCNSRSE